MRYQWLVVRLDAIDKGELRELVFDAWRRIEAAIHPERKGSVAID